MDGIVTDQERLDSAHKLFGRSAESTLSAIDSVPNPADQSDPSTRNVRGVDDPAKWVIPQVDVAPPGDMPPKPKGPAFLDQIPDAAAALRQPSAAPPAAPPAFLSDIPDAASPLQQAHAEASVFDATHSAIVRRLANQFGQPPEFIDKNISQAKAQAAAPTPSFFQMMEQNYPGSTKFYAQPENMAVAHDDMPNTVQHEAAVQVGGQSISLWDLFKTGAGRSALGDIATGGKQDQVPQDLDSVQRLALGAGQILPDLPVMALGGAVTAPLGAAAGGPAGALVAAGAGAMGTPAAVHEVLKEYRSGEIKSVPDLVRAFIRVEKSVGKSMLVGGVAAAGGVLAGPQGALAALATENALLTVGGKAAEGELKNANDVMQYATSPEAARDYTDNLLLGLGLHGVTHLTAADAKKVAVTQDQRVKQQFYDAIGQTAEASKLRERLPDVHSDFVDGLVKGGPMQDVYLPVDAATSYFQKNGIDIEDVADGLGVRDSLAEARATGGDIKIPLAKWLEKMVGTEHYKALREDIKFSPEDLSPRQSAEIESETRARVQDAADQALKDAEIPEDADQDGKIEAAQKVYQDMQEKLTAAGLSGAEVKHNPTLFREFFSTLADRINESAPDDQKVDALDLQQRFNVDVNKFETPAERDAVRGTATELASQNQTFDQRNSLKRSPIQKELEAELGKDLGIDLYDGKYVRGAEEHNYDIAGVSGERAKRAKKLGFDTNNVWFHGSRADIENFSGDTLGGSTGAGSARIAHFFASSPDTASDYAEASTNKLSLRASKTEAEATRARDEFNSQMREKYGSDWTKNLTKEERVQRAVIKKQLTQSAEDFERSTRASAARVDLQKWHVDQAENGVKFLENKIKNRDWEAENKKMKSYIKQLRKQVGPDKEWVKNDGAFNVIDKATGEKLINPHLSESEGDRKFRFYSSEQSVKDSIDKLEARLAENTPERLAKELEDAKDHMAELRDDFQKTLEGVDGQTVYKTLLKTKRPLIVDFNGAEYREVTYRRILEKAQEHGHDSVIFKNTYDPAFVGGGTREPDLMDVAAVFDPSQIRSVNAEFNPKEADSPNILAQGDENNPRGQISFAGRQFNIDLFKEKDVSTFLHETGHYFLEVMGHVVEGEGAGSEGLQKDYATILKYLGVNERGEIGSEQHEKFARAFETYLSEGKAPSEGLRQAFSQFRRWLTDLWRKVSFAKVEVSPELRDVFDRMLGAEDGVSEARRSLDMEKEFNLDGVDEKTKSEIETLRERARSRAEETLLKERLKETKSEYRDHLAEERAKFRAVAEDQVREEPLFKAIDQLQEQMSGRDPYGVAEAALRGELTPEDSTEFQMLADEHGFTTAQEMAEKISEAGATNLFDTKVSDMTEEALRNVGAIKDPAALREEALKAVHSEDAEQLMALEREALIDLAAKRVASVERRAQNRAQAKLEIQAAKGEAQMILSKMPAEEAGRPQRFITQERNAAARVARFVARKDFEKAAEAKQQQLVAHALVRESFRINEEMEKHLKYIRQFMGRRGSLLDMPFGFVRQLDVMLDRFGFQTMPKEDEKTLQTIATGMAQEGQSAHDIANATGYVEDAQGRLQPESLAQFVERQNENYHAMEFPPEVMGAIRRDSKDLTLDELRAVRETMQTIAEGGRKHDRFLNEFIKVDIKEAAMKFRQKVESTFGKPYEEQLLPGQTEQGKLADLLDTLQHFPDALNRTLDTVLTTCHKFDGLEEGPAKEFIYRPMAEAEARKTTRMRESMAEMEAIFAKHYDESEFAKYKDTEIAQNGRKYTKEQILSMALNWGNGGNRQRLFSMPGLDEAAVRNLFSNLTKKDWDFAQDTWDHIDKYWPEIKKLEMAVNGVEPSKVEALKFNNEHGEYKGGYYPIAYDFEKSADAFQHNQTKDALFKQYSTAKAATAQGHTQARVARVTRPLRLSLDVLANHHEDIIHDLEFRRAVIDINRFLGERDTKTAITNAVGVRGYGAMQDWLKSVAGGNSEPLTAWDRAAQWFRFKTTFFNLGYRLTSAPKIAIENAVNTASEIGWSGTARAIKNYYLGDGSHEMVIEKSPFMRERASHLDRDMGDLIDKQRGEGQGAFQKYAFFVHSYLDRGMSFPLWADTYRRSLAEGAAERLAVHQADESVKRTFMTGGRVDQASFARGSELKKAMTVAYGYQSMMWNRFSRQRFQASMEWNNGNHLQAAATMAMSTVYTFAFPAAVAALTREFLRNGPASSGQDEKKRMLISALEEATPLKFVPLARDLNVYALRKASGEHVGDLQLAPLEGMMQTLINPVAEAASGKHSQRFPEESAGALSFMFGIPRQVNDVAFNFLDWQHGNGALTWRDALGRRHKK